MAFILLILWCKQNYLVPKHFIIPRGNPLFIKLLCSIPLSLGRLKPVSAIWISVYEFGFKAVWPLVCGISISTFQGHLCSIISALHSLLWPMVFWDVYIYNIYIDIQIHNADIQYFLIYFSAEEYLSGFNLLSIVLTAAIKICKYVFAWMLAFNYFDYTPMNGTSRSYDNLMRKSTAILHRFTVVEY